MTEAVAIDPIWRASRILVPVDAERARVQLARALDNDAIGTLGRLLAAEASLTPLLEGLLGLSSYVADLAAMDPARLAALFCWAPEKHAAALAERARTLEAPDAEQLGHGLRRIKQELALLVAAADLGKVWDTSTTGHVMSEVAGALISRAVRFALGEAAARGDLELVDAADPERGSGLIVLGMGKLGANELNYSSDIDLVVFFDRAVARARRRDDDIDIFARLTKRVVTLLADYTSDGYVFRVDLRLRPDGSATPIAIPLEAAISYYESVAQTWERAAYIKARPVAGDIEAGRRFLEFLAPFVWRRHFDFSAIGEIAAMKRRIQAHKGHGTTKVAGHDIKLGRGGIREIEFFAQTQQLVLGGVERRLRARETLVALDALVADGWIGAGVRDALRDAYLFLRDTENRIQMVADQQSHRLPESQAGVAAIGRMMGFQDAELFAAALLGHLDAVQAHYELLFETTLHLPQTGALSFSGHEDHPETAAALATMGFADPARAAALVRGWLAGRVPATRSQTSRERLTALVPALLHAVAETGNADAALLGFDRLVERMPAGVQFFSLIAAHPNLLALLADILGSAPALAETISHHPRVFAALIEPGFFGEPRAPWDWRARLARRFEGAETLEDVLDRARVFGQEQKFLVGVRVLSATNSIAESGRDYAELAEAVIEGLFEKIQRDFEKQHGRLVDGAASVVAMGKLGGREMTAASDLDLMMLYEGDTHAMSDGARSLAAPHYYARLTQRLIAALSVPTAEGELYEVDMRLRPSGNSGPIALRLAGFVDYQRDSAWTWEHMALTRARVVAGDAAFGRQVDGAIATVLTGARDKAQLRQDVLDMRLRMAAAKGSDDPWEVKLVRGGLVDVEFIAQYLMLREAHAAPSVLDTKTGAALARLESVGALPADMATTLRQACDLYQGLTQILRLAMRGRFNPDDAPRGLIDALLRHTGEPDIVRVEARLRDQQQAVRECYARVFET